MATVSDSINTASLADNDMLEQLHKLTDMKKAINIISTQVMVMAEDEAVKYQSISYTGRYCRQHRQGRGFLELVW